MTNIELAFQLSERSASLRILFHFFFSKQLATKRTAGIYSTQGRWPEIWNLNYHASDKWWCPIHGGRKFILVSLLWFNPRSARYQSQGGPNWDISWTVNWIFSQHLLNMVLEASDNLIDISCVFRGMSRYRNEPTRWLFTHHLVEV